MVLASGSAALEQLPAQDAAVIARVRASLQSKIPRLGAQSSLELITALGIYLAQMQDRPR